MQRTSFHHSDLEMTIPTPPPLLFGKSIGNRMEQLSQSETLVACGGPNRQCGQGGSAGLLSSTVQIDIHWITESKAGVGSDDVESTKRPLSTRVELIRGLKNVDLLPCLRMLFALWT